MSDPAVLSDDEIKHLRTLIRHGRLFQVQQWIAEGKPIFFPNVKFEQMLGVAVDSGFHSMVEVLAKAWPDHESLNNCLQKAANKRRADIVWLLLGNGADISAVYLESIAQCYDRDLMRHFFEHWNEIDQTQKLFQVVTAKVQMMLGFIREYAPRLPNHEFELAMALKEFINDENPKWVSLALWMGADPRLPVPDPRWSHGEKEYDPEECSTAMEDAIWRKRMDIIKLMKISPEKDDLNELLSHLWITRDGGLDVAEYLIKLGANINNKPNGGSSILDGLLGKWEFMLRMVNQNDFRYSAIDVTEVSKWINRGARFVPDDSDYRQYREAIYTLPEWSARDLLKKLAFATEPKIFQKLVGTPKMREHLGMAKSISVSTNPLGNRVRGRRHG